MLAASHVETDQISGQLKLPPRFLSPSQRFAENLRVATRHHVGPVTLHLSPAGTGQVFLVAQPTWGADASQVAAVAYDEIARVLQDQGLTIVHERLFGSLKIKAAVMSARETALRTNNLPVDGPLTYIQSKPPWGEGFAGAIIQAVSCRNPQDEVWTIQDRGKPVGRGWWRQETTVLFPFRGSWPALPPRDVMNGYKWELYDLTKDWTQNDDLAVSNPAKLKEMQKLFVAEAKKYQVFPLDNSLATRMVTPRPSVTAGRTEFTYHGEITGIPMGDAPMLLDASYTITAEVELPQGGGEGMLATQGGRFGGWGFYLLKGKPVYVWNLLDLKRVRWEGPEALAPGKHTLEFDFKYDGLGLGTLAFNNPSGIGRGATGVLKVDGKEVATQKMERTIQLTVPWDESFDVGADTGTPVDDNDYQVPFKITGKLNKLNLKIDRPKLSPEDEKKLMEGSQRNNRASE